VLNVLYANINNEDWRKYMDELEKLWEHVRTRPEELRKMQKDGIKIVGYAPGGYMPEELVCASGAMPVGLIRGGDADPVRVSLAYFPRFIDTFCRSQIGYRVMKEDPLYQMVDLVVVPVTDRNMEAVADSWEMWTDVDLFKLPVPLGRTEFGLKYYLKRLNQLKQTLEELTGEKIKEERLKEEIELTNRMRDLLKEISYTRKSERPLISGRDFIRLNHATFLADRKILLEALESLAQKLKSQEAPSPTGPRIFLTGSTIALGDYKVIDLLDETGAQIVIEEFAEGMRHYWEKVKVNGDLIEALADRYYWRRVPLPAFMRPSTGERIDFYLNLIKEFKVDGIVWYSLMYRDAYDIEGFFFEDVLRKETRLPMLKLNSDYDIHAEISPFRTRIESFMEVVKGR